MKATLFYLLTKPTLKDLLKYQNTSSNHMSDQDQEFNPLDFHFVKNGVIEGFFKLEDGNIYYLKNWWS